MGRRKRNRSGGIGRSLSRFPANSAWGEPSVSRRTRPTQSDCKAHSRPGLIAIRSSAPLSSGPKPRHVATLQVNILRDRHLSPHDLSRGLHAIQSASIFLRRGGYGSTRRLVSRLGFEPRTPALKGQCSTIELPARLTVTCRLARCDVSDRAVVRAPHEPCGAYPYKTTLPHPLS